MFKFNFSEIELDGEFEETRENTASASQSTAPSVSNLDEKTERFREISLEELTRALPPALSYSPIVIPIGPDEENRPSVTLLRRDLFDVRFQLIAQDDEVERAREGYAKEPQANASDVGEAMSDSETAHDAIAFVDNPSDLLPGVYEGGLKTWECSLDLVEALSTLPLGSGLASDVRGKRVLELGCGTAVPSLFLLHELFEHSSKTTQRANGRLPASGIILQDYNELVLRLVTFPNVLLTWYASPLAEAYREKQKAEDEEQETLFKPNESGEIAVIPELISAFASSLDEHRIRISFIAGSWEAMLHSSPRTISVDSVSSTDIFARPFDIVLTSETIYRFSILPTLTTLLKTASSMQSINEMQRSDSTLESSTKDLAIHSGREPRTLCLTAAKILYFGVGGGVVDFERIVKEHGGNLETVLEKRTGVGRKVMKINWYE